jgi:hypothetical protein
MILLSLIYNFINTSQIWLPIMCFSTINLSKATYDVMLESKSMITVTRVSDRNQLYTSC